MNKQRWIDVLEAAGQLALDYAKFVSRVSEGTPVPPTVGNPINWGNPTPAPDPGPVEAHLGEIVHYQATEGGGCLPAVTVRPGPAPMLAVFFHASPEFGHALEYHHDVPHWEACLEATEPRWHCACECVQATGGDA